MPFGIGRSIYAVPRRFLFAQEAKRSPRDKLRRRGERLYLTEANELLLREEYERWLAAVGIAAFGEPLDHGPDQAEAVEEEGDQAEDAEAPVADVEAPAGGLRAVSGGASQEAPATIHERLMGLIAATGYTEQTVKGAGRAHARRAAARPLSARQVGELERMVSAASRGAIETRARNGWGARESDQGVGRRFAVGSTGWCETVNGATSGGEPREPPALPIAARAAPSRPERPTAVVLHHSVRELRRSRCPPSSNVSLSPTTRS